MSHRSGRTAADRQVRLSRARALALAATVCGMTLATTISGCSMAAAPVSTAGPVELAASSSASDLSGSAGSGPAGSPALDVSSAPDPSLADASTTATPTDADPGASVPPSGRAVPGGTTTAPVPTPRGSVRRVSPSPTSPARASSAAAGRSAAARSSTAAAKASASRAVGAAKTAAALLSEDGAAASRAATGPVLLLGAGTESVAEAEVVRLVNAQRTAAGCPAVTADGTLVQLARAHSDDMAGAAGFKHNGSDGRTPFQRMTAAGYDYSVAAENIAAGQPNAGAVMAAWMASPGHQANILDCRFTQIGVGVVNRPGTPYVVYWTQEFATPM